MAKRNNSAHHLGLTIIIAVLLFILPLFVLAISRNTSTHVEAAPIPPTLEETFKGGSSGSSRVAVSGVTGSSSSLYLATISTKPFATITSLTGLGLKWTKIKNQCAARSQTGVEIWMASGNPISGNTVTAGLSRSPLNSVITVSRFSGVDLSDPVSDALGLNTRGLNGSCSGGSDTDGYSTSFQSDRNSLIYGAVAIRLRSHTEGTGFTEVMEYGRGSDGDKVGLALVKNYQNTSVPILFSGKLSSETDWAAIAVQVHGMAELVVPTQAPTIAPTIVPTVRPTLPPGPTVVISPTTSPRPTQLPVPTTPPGNPVTGIWTSASELSSKPVSGDAWNAVKASADSLSASANPDLDNQDDETNVKVLAAAIVYSRNGDVAYRNKVVAALQKVETFNPTGRTLAWARETGAYALAAELVGYRSTAFVNKMRAMAETYKCSQLGVNMLEMFKKRPNNWGSQAFGSLTAIYSYLGDRAKLTEVRDFYIKGVMGPKPSETTYGSLSWQCSESDPRIINPAGCSKTCGGTRVNVDGIIPDDMRRGGSCSSNPGFTGYPWEGLQGYVMGARILERAGMPIWSVGDRAICRAASALQDGRFGNSWKATGDDQWQLPFLDAACGTSWSSSYGTGKWGSGKNTGWAYVIN